MKLESQSKPRSNLNQRLSTAAIGAPLVIAIIIWSWWSTSILLLIILSLATYEYWHVTQHQTTWRAYGFGILYLGLPLLAGLWLRSTEDGAFWLLLILFSNWLTDTAAYFAGRMWGHTPFAPRISPKKTWEGVFGGIMGGFVTALLFAFVLGHGISITIILIGLTVPIATIIGDLLESRIKRRYGVKDSGRLLPGHGGILDRIDGTLVALVIAALIVRLTV